MHKYKKKYNRVKYTKLVFSIIIDVIGYVSYTIPALGEFVDVIWAVLSGLSILIMYPNQKKMAVLGFAEEFFPGTDFIPTACTTWALVYKKNADKTWRTFLEKYVKDEQIYNEVMLGLEKESKKLFK